MTVDMLRTLLAGRAHRTFLNRVSKNMDDILFLGYLIDFKAR
jgi:hypothetical protein